MPKYIVDEIGDSYENWCPGDIICINSPTGSGKTTFILDTLLPYVANKVNPSKILYLLTDVFLKVRSMLKLRKISVLCSI